MRVERQAVHTGDEVLIDPFTLGFEIMEGEVTSTEGLTRELEEVGDEDTVEVSADPTRLPEPNPAAKKRRARLMTIQGQRLAASYPVRPTGLTIGRSEARDVILFDPAASSNHAQLEWVGADMWLRDHGGNGTFVNGSRVREQCLRHGDRVRVGSTEFRFEWADGPVNEPPTLPASQLHNRRQAEAQSDQTLRMRIPSSDDSWTMPPSDQGARLVATAAIGGFAVAAVMIVGGLLALYVVDFDWRGTKQAQAVAILIPQAAKATWPAFKQGHSHLRMGHLKQHLSSMRRKSWSTGTQSPSVWRSDQPRRCCSTRSGRVSYCAVFQSQSSACVARARFVSLPALSPAGGTRPKQRMPCERCWFLLRMMTGFETC